MFAITKLLFAVTLLACLVHREVEAIAASKSAFELEDIAPKIAVDHSNVIAADSSPLKKRKLLRKKKLVPQHNKTSTSFKQQAHYYTNIFQSLLKEEERYRSLQDMERQAKLRHVLSRVLS